MQFGSGRTLGAEVGRQLTYVIPRCLVDKPDPTHSGVSSTFGNLIRKKCYKTLVIQCVLGRIIIIVPGSKTFDKNIEKLSGKNTTTM